MSIIRQALPTGAENFPFSQKSAKIQKSSTMKGPKLPFWESSYINQRLIVSNLKNHSVTDRQTDKMTTITLSRIRAEAMKELLIGVKWYMNGSDKKCYSRYVSEVP